MSLLSAELYDWSQDWAATAPNSDVTNLAKYNTERWLTEVNTDADAYLQKGYFQMIKGNYQDSTIYWLGMTAQVNFA